MRRHLALRLAELLFVLMLLGVGFLLGQALTGCDGTGVLQHRPLYESWDQERLKANDHGCPTAIYIAPHGELVQCPPQETPR
jgi:hypothetical protein